MSHDEGCLEQHLGDCAVSGLVTAPSITCPRCGRTSYNPNDVREGYCGACHDWTRT